MRDLSSQGPVESTNTLQIPSAAVKSLAPDILLELRVVPSIRAVMICPRGFGVVSFCSWRDRRGVPQDMVSSI